MKHPPSAVSEWWVYILRCADGSLYTGITRDVDRRLAEHNGEGGAGARYTRARRPVSLAYCEPAVDRAAASRREAEIKALDRTQKDQFLAARRRPA